MTQEVSNEQLANAGVVGVNALAGWSWLSAANDVLQLVLTFLGIVAALVAIRYHVKKTQKLDDAE